MNDKDLINNPKHYDLFADGTKSFDVIRNTLTPEEYIGFLKGNILKYRLEQVKKVMPVFVLVAKQQIAHFWDYSAKKY